MCMICKFVLKTVKTRLLPPYEFNILLLNFYQPSVEYFNVSST